MSGSTGNISGTGGSLSKIGQFCVCGLSYALSVIPNISAVNSKEECIAADTTILERKKNIVAEDYSAQNMNITKR